MLRTEHIRTNLSRGVCLTLLALCWVGTVAAAEKPRLGIPELLPSQDFLQRELPGYNNYAFQPFVNYPDHAPPYADRPRAYYSSFGDYLITGYDLYDWNEQRTPGQEYGSSIFKEWNQWGSVFNFMVVARDGYGSWGYSAIVGDALIARFTPLTLSKVDFNGARLDVSTPYLKFTGLASRIERPRFYVESESAWIIDGVHFADDSTLLLGSRVQTDIGALQLGFNGVNMHVYQSTQPGNSLKGSLRPHLPSMDQVVVRFTDDSPGDGSGAVVQEVQLVINGEARPDIEPTVVRHQQGVQTQVGSVSRLTGAFRPTIYTNPQGYFNTATLFYRGRNDMPLFADYFYRADHEAGIDVSEETNLEGLLATFALESPREVLQVKDNEELVFLYDLSQLSYVESVEVEAVLGNDYRVDVATLNLNNPRARGYALQYLSTFYRSVLRADGNVQDMSNLGKRRFEVGENTAIFTYSADLHLGLAGLEINAEYARSALYSRFPARLDGTQLYHQAPRFAEHGSAYFVNAVRWFERGRVGGEYFAITPDFKTEMRTFLQMGIGLTETTLGGMINNTVYWELVQDNEDGDRYPDKRIGNLSGLPNDRRDSDVDGVFPGQDEDNDGLPDINRNFNSVPDYVEPFLMYDIESNDYVYGLDRNNNGDPDMREDDLDVDYPYDYDQRGFHLFGQLDLTRHWSVGAGRYDVEQIAGGGRNESTYALLTYRREGLERLQRVFFENNFRRVHDDIADEFAVLIEQPRLVEADFRGLTAGNKPSFSSQMVGDPLLYKDSYVNETYAEGWFNPWSALNVVQKFRRRFNWQQGGVLPGGLTQRDRRIDFTTWVSRVDYTWHWGKVKIQPQYKFLLLNLADQDADRQTDGSYAGRDLRSEWSSIPILRLSLPLMQRSVLQVGLQGLGPLPYRVEDRVQERNSFEQRTLFVNMTNRSRYFGYDMRTIVGFQRDVKEFEDLSRQGDGFDALTFFARVLIGFTEYGRPL